MLDPLAMPKYELDIPHSLPPAEVRSRLQRATTKLESQYGAECKWQNDDRLLVSRKGLTASLNVEPARVHVNLELGFLMAPLAGGIRAGITKQLQDLLSA